MAHRKGGGSSTNGRDSYGQRLGVKRFGGQLVNAGTILDGSESLNSVGRRIFQMIVDTADGRLTKAEALGYHDYIVFKRSREAEHLLGHC